MKCVLALPSLGCVKAVPPEAAAMLLEAALAAHRPLVLLLDDLHWADQPSLDLLRYLARPVAGCA
mgnify:CR=1 FL=1